MSQGIDRTDLHDYSITGSHSQSRCHDGRLDSLDAGRRSESTNVRHFSKISQIKAKAKKLFRIPSNSTVTHKTTNARTLAPRPESASDSDRLVQDVPQCKRPPVREIIRNPIETVQSVVRGAGGEQVAESLQNKAIPHGADVRLVRAYDKVATTSTETERIQAVQGWDELKETRQDLFVRWTIDRHLRQVRSSPAKTVIWQSRKDFVVVDEHGIEQMQWAKYGRHVGLRLCYTTIVTAKLLYSFPRENYSGGAAMC
jgi:hypothetical protein